VLRAEVEPEWSLAAWRDAARGALRAGAAPDGVVWNAGAQGDLLGGDSIAMPAGASALRMPRAFFQLAETVLCHRDPQRHALLYRLLWRIAQGERHLLSLPTDADVHRAAELAAAVRRDSHKMKAFVRFRAIGTSNDDFVAWFEPYHWIVDRVAPFFARRLAGMRWAILTPYRSVRWDGSALEFGAGATRADAPAEDAREDWWRTYYANIFNPARLNPRMMTQEMPQKYWKHLPETALLPDLLRTARERTHAMIEREAVPARRKIRAAPAVMHETHVDADTNLQQVRESARRCRACPLWEPATQTVFGEGPELARAMLIGEQPGDQEDLTGRPFVGPAGQLLDRALDELGVARDALYLTNAVKHFRFELRGKRRLHKNPEKAHIAACRPWLDAEIARVRPQIVVCLGANAATAVLGSSFRLMSERGRWITVGDARRVFATVHPAWVLRQSGDAERESAYRGFVDDLRLLQAALAEAA